MPHQQAERGDVGHRGAAAVAVPQHQPGQPVGIMAGKRFDHALTQLGDIGGAGDRQWFGRGRVLRR
jgi:hypothetical protein